MQITRSLVLLSTVAVLLVPTVTSAKSPRPGPASLANGFAMQTKLAPRTRAFGDRLRLIRTNMRTARHDSTRPATSALLRIRYGRPRLTDPLDIAITPLVWPINVATGVALGARGERYVGLRGTR
jgi:hypothetical protein